MAEEFLEEQLERIREMTEQVSRVRPLCDVRDLTNRPSDDDDNARAREEQPSTPRHIARDSSRRRAR